MHLASGASSTSPRQGLIFGTTDLTWVRVVLPRGGSALLRVCFILPLQSWTSLSGFQQETLCAEEGRVGRHGRVSISFSLSHGLIPHWSCVWPVLGTLLVAGSVLSLSALLSVGSCCLWCIWSCRGVAAALLIQGSTETLAHLPIQIVQVSHGQRRAGDNWGGSDSLCLVSCPVGSVCSLHPGLHPHRLLPLAHQLPGARTGQVAPRWHLEGGNPAQFQPGPHLPAVLRGREVPRNGG